MNIVSPTSGISSNPAPVSNTQNASTVKDALNALKRELTGKSFDDIAIGRAAAKIGHQYGVFPTTLKKMFKELYVVTEDSLSERCNYFLALSSKIDSGSDIRKELDSIILEGYSETSAWYNTKTKEMLISSRTHRDYILAHPEKFGIDPDDQSLRLVNTVVQQGWIRIGTYELSGYVAAKDDILARKGVKALIDRFPWVSSISVEITPGFNPALDRTVFLRNDDIANYIRHGTIPKRLTESKSSGTIVRKSAFTIARELSQHAKTLTDSSNVSIPNNFESYESQDKITVRVSVFNKNTEKLLEIEKMIEDKLFKQGWTIDSKNKKKFIRDGAEISVTPIQKVFRPGTYQNKEVPHIGFKITGPKKTTKSIQEEL